MSQLIDKLRARIPAPAIPVLGLVLCAWQAQPQVITTIAGSGAEGFSGDGGPAISASFKNPRATPVDSTGAVYIADTDNYRIRKISPNGTIETLAGTGVMGYFGDGGLAVNAELSDASGLVLDGAGNIYVGDASNRRVRKITPGGLITTIAGTGIQGFSGDGGPAASAMLGRPFSLAIDAGGNLYIADSVNERVRKIDLNGTITTIAGNGRAGFSGDGGLAINASLQTPVGVAVDQAGNVYIADGDNNRIRQVSAGGIITTFAGNGSEGFSGDGGLAVNAMINIPYDVAVDAAGNVYIADAGNNRVRRVSTSNIITTVAGTDTNGFGGDGGPATLAILNFPWGLATDASGNVYVGDRANERVRKIAFGSALPPPGPVLSESASVVNGASFSPTAPVAPGSAVSIFGTDLATALLVASSATLPTAIGETSVTFNGVAVPLYFVSSGQINAQVPFEVGLGNLSVQVTVGGQVSAPQTINVAAFSPGIFTVDSAGTGAFLHASDYVMVSSSAPAQPGEYILIYATGLGALRTPVPSGTPAPSNPPAETSITPVVAIGGLSSQVSFSGLAPGFVGLYQVNAQVPLSLAAGNQTVQISADGVFSNTAMLAVGR
jgi:uncharacterized protein (TIGR03437 family)